MDGEEQENTEEIYEWVSPKYTNWWSRVGARRLKFL